MTAGFDTEAFFTDDYTYFVEVQLPPERTTAETRLICSLLSQDTPELRILDLGCGTGRISLELARRGHQVHGTDTNPAYIRAAVSRARDAELPATFEVADMRGHLPDPPRDARGGWDAVLLWSNTFGYFDDLVNRDLLRRIRDRLRPGGVLLLDQHNRDWVLRHWQDTLMTRRGEDFFIDENRFDLLTGRTENRRTYLRAGHLTGTATFASRLFCPPELRTWLDEAGYTDTRFQGEDGEPLHREHRRQVVRTTRPTPRPPRRGRAW